MTEHERFHVREVDDAARRYRFVSSDRRFHDACIAADTARVEWAGHYVVTDSHRDHAIVYDSRRLERQRPTP